MNDAERAPLLSAAPPDAPSPAIAIATLLSSLAALRAGNLPSNSQLHQIITELLNSSLLSVDGTIWTSEYGTGRIGVGKLSREGENGRVGLRGLLSSFREWIEGRNEGEVLQELVHSLRETEIQLKAGAKKESVPIRKATNEIKELLLLFFTAPEMRALFVDFVELAKGAVSDVVEGTGPLKSTVNGVMGGKGKAAEDLEQAKDDFIDRLVKVLLAIQSTPWYQSSIRILISFIKSSIPGPTSLPRPTLSTPTTDTPTRFIIRLIENHTGGPESLNPVEESYRNLVEASVGEESLVGLLSRVEALLERLLVDAGCLHTSSFRRELDKIYDDFSSIRSSSTVLGGALRAFLSNLSGVLTAIVSDDVLTNLLSKVGGLLGAMEIWSVQAMKIVSGRNRIWGDVIEVIVPRLLSIVKELPLPRIEFASPNLDIAIEAPTFLSTSFIPDLITVDTHSSLHYAPATTSAPSPHSHHLATQRSPPPSTEESTTDFETRSTIKISGLRMQIEELGYWIHYKGPCGIGFVDSGLLGIGIGSMVPIQEGGIEAIITLSTPLASSSDDSDAEGGIEGPANLFDIESLALSLKSFSLTLPNTSHPFLSSLLLSANPATQTIIQAQIESLLSTYLRGGLEKVSIFGGKVVGRMKTRQGVGRAIWETLMEEEEVEQEVQIDEAEETEIEIRLTKTGVLIELDEEAAVGIGRSSLVLPSDQDTSTSLPRPTIGEIVREQYSDSIRNAQEVVEDVGDGLGAIVEGVSGFKETVEKEKARKGWRSTAFDF